MYFRSDFVANSSEIGHLAGPSGRAFQSIPGKPFKRLQFRLVFAGIEFC